MKLEKSKSFSLTDKRFRYTLFYKKDTGELYAYTDNKTLARAFKLTRKESIFITEQKMLSSSDLKDIYDEVPDTLLLSYQFCLGKNTITLPITTREKLDLEHTVVQVLNVNIYLSARINPDIFTEKIKESLRKINYVDVYRDSTSGEYMRPEALKPDYLTCFLSLYGDTMKERW